MMGWNPLIELGLAVQTNGTTSGLNLPVSTKMGKYEVRSETTIQIVQVRSASKLALPDAAQRRRLTQTLCLLDVLLDVHLLV